ncbi:MAG: hypothetical protein ABIV50_08795 [Opitutus sp.]
MSHQTRLPDVALVRSSVLGRLAASCCFALALVGLGCATGDYAYVTTTASGERIQIPLKGGSPERAKKGNLTVMHAALIPSPTRDKKELLYLFGLQDSSAVPPSEIRVEDVTEDHAILMVEEKNPKFSKNLWSSTSKLFSGTDPEMNWVSHLDNSMRVFRFTVTGADGTKTVLNQGWMVPGWAKVPMRTALGMK